MKFYNLIRYLRFYLKLFFINFQKIGNNFSYIQYIKNRRGLEIGGPSSIFAKDGVVPIYGKVTVLDNCLFSQRTVWDNASSEKGFFSFSLGGIYDHHYILEASNLDLIKPCKYDFLISSHCLEHVANPIKALHEWIRVLKDEGLLVLVFPHKDGTFDHCRDVTALDHLIEDYNNEVDESDLTHLDEILKFHDIAMDSGVANLDFFIERSKKNFQNRCLHHHVFDTYSAILLINYMRLKILSVSLVSPLNIIIFAKKYTEPEGINNASFLDKKTELFKNSPFLSDRG